MRFSVIALLGATVSSTSLQGSQLHKSSGFQLEIYRRQNHALLELLVTEGCVKLPVQKRSLHEPALTTLDTQLEATRLAYKHLTDELIACRKEKRTRPATTITTTTPTTTTTTPTTTTSTTTTPKNTTPTTTTPSTTTVTPLPAECRSAINLTEYWRKDHSDTGIKPVNGDHNCDTRDMIAAGRPWFRFAGSAGNRLLDHCVPSYRGGNTGSCGTVSALRSDDPMPTVVGVITAIQVYPSQSQNCTHNGDKFDCHVLKCSMEPHDYIYRYIDGRNGCHIGFCGMA